MLPPGRRRFRRPGTVAGTRLPPPSGPPRQGRLCPPPRPPPPRRGHRCPRPAPSPAEAEAPSTWWPSSTARCSWLTARGGRRRVPVVRAARWRWVKSSIVWGARGGRLLCEGRGGLYGNLSCNQIDHSMSQLPLFTSDVTVWLFPFHPPGACTDHSTCCSTCCGTCCDVSGAWGRWSGGGGTEWQPRGHGAGGSMQIVTDTVNRCGKQIQ